MKPRGSDTAARSPAYLGYVLVLLIVTSTLSYADRYLFAILLPAMKADLQLSDSVLGWIGGPAFTLSFVTLSMPLAALADRWSRRKVLALCAATWSVATACCGVGNSVAQLAAARMTVGIGEAGGGPAAQSIIAGLFPARLRTTAFGFLSSSNYLGVVLGFAGGGLLASWLGWRATFLILGAPGLLTALLVWTTAPRRAPAAEETFPAASVSIWQAVRRCFAIPSFRWLALGMGIYNIFGHALAIWMPSYFMRSHGMSVSETGFWMGFGSAIGGIAGSISSGPIVDRLIRRDIRWQLRVPAIGIGLSLPLMTWILLVPRGAALELGGHAIPVVALLSIASSYCAALWQGPGYAATATMVAPALRSQAMAMMTVTVMVIGAMVGPILAGAVSDAFTTRYGNEALRYSLLTMTVLIPVGMLLIWRASSLYRGTASGQD